MDWVFDSLTAMNIILGVVLCIKEFQLAKKCRKPCIKQWAIMILGIYWATLYTIVLVVPDGVLNPVTFGRIWVRPAFTMTLSMLVILAHRNKA